MKPYNKLKAEMLVIQQQMIETKNERVKSFEKVNYLFKETVFTTSILNRLLVRELGKK